MTDMHDAKDAFRKRRRSKRSLTAEEKLQIWLELLSGESSQRDAAQRWGVDPTTIMRIRKVARAGALSKDAPRRSTTRSRPRPATTRTAARGASAWRTSAAAGTTSSPIAVTG
jgi:transposase-like protein